MKTWMDKETKLEWQVDAGKRMDWHDAIEGAHNLGDNWRLPTVNELIALVDYEKYDPCCVTDSLKCHLTYYWSSTTFKGDPGDAWRVNFNLGLVGCCDKETAVYVRYVRGEQ